MGSAMGDAGLCMGLAGRGHGGGAGGGPRLYAAMSRADLGVTMHKSGGELPGFCGVDFALIVPCLLQDGQMAEPHCGISVARSHLNTHRAASGAWSSSRWIPGRSLHVNFPRECLSFFSTLEKN